MEQQQYKEVTTHVLSQVATCSDTPFNVARTERLPVEQHSKVAMRGRKTTTNKTKQEEHIVRQAGASGKWPSY